MRSLQLNFEGAGGVSVAWGEEVTGLRGLAQKVTCGALTQEGSDKLVTDRGTDALRRILASGAFDIMAIQHALNFAALKTAADTRAAQDTTDASYTLASVQMKLIGINNGNAQVSIAVGAADGSTTRTITEIL